jgi:hypothetical protein
MFSLTQELFEHQVKEIFSLKQQLNEYENNNLECNRKWQNLIAVNYFSLVFLNVFFFF